MKIALISPPFIPVPPRRYGGTELFVAHLASGLAQLGHDVVVYSNGESTFSGHVRWMFEQMEWPLQAGSDGQLKNLTHHGWAIRDAAGFADVIHINDAIGTFFAPFTSQPFFLTLHHPHEPELCRTYERFPEIRYVAISRYQESKHRMPRLTTIHHGIQVSDYQLVQKKQPYLAFLGRFAPCKGAEFAIDIAKRVGMPIKLAGEIQPQFHDYWRAAIEPHVDGRQVEYVGEADLAAKNELLGNATALLNPIQWDEPFGLVMLEAMACGTPVIASARGSVPEIVENGTSGWACGSVDEMVTRVSTLSTVPALCRRHVVEGFSLERMAERYEALYRGDVTEKSFDSPVACEDERISLMPVVDAAREASVWKS